MLRRFDTYKSAGLLVTSFIDASQRVPEDEINIVDEAGAAAKEKEEQSNEGKIVLKFQSDRRRGAEMIWVAKDERFEGIMARYAAKAGVDLAALKFLFDGEPLGRLDTPLDLDLEGGECIDVHVDAKSARKPPPPPRYAHSSLKLWKLGHFLNTALHSIKEKLEDILGLVLDSTTFVL